MEMPQSLVAQSSMFHRPKFLTHREQLAEVCQHQLHYLPWEQAVTRIKEVLNLPPEHAAGLLLDARVQSK